MDFITFSENLLTTSGLSILLHGVISLPGAMSYDNMKYLIYKDKTIKETFCLRATFVLYTQINRLFWMILSLTKHFNKN